MAQLLNFSFGLSRRNRDDVIDFPFAPILPRHALSELFFQMSFQLLPSAANHTGNFVGPIQLTAHAFVFNRMPDTLFGDFT